MCGTLRRATFLSGRTEHDLLLIADVANAFARDIAWRNTYCQGRLPDRRNDDISHVHQPLGNGVSALHPTNQKE